MRYETFKSLLKEKIEEKMPGYMAEPRTVSKNGENYDGISVSKVAENIGTIFRLEELWNDFQNGATMDACAAKVVEFMQKNEDTKKEVEKMVSDGLISLESLEVRVANKKSKVLCGTIHRTLFSDVEKYLVFQKEAEETWASTKVNDSLLAHFGITEEDAWKIAESNMRKKAVLKDVLDVLKKCIINIEGEIPEIDMDAEKEILVLTTETGCAKIKHDYGAFLGYDQKSLEVIARMIGSFYIIPSSIHEVLLVRKEKNDADTSQFSEMVHEVNLTQVAPEERLSENVCYFDAKKNQLSVEYDISEEVPEWYFGYTTA